MIVHIQIDVYPVNWHLLGENSFLQNKEEFCFSENKTFWVTEIWGQHAKYLSCFSAFSMKSNIHVTLENCQNIFELRLMTQSRFSLLDICDLVENMHSTFLFLQ